ncbi:hypothetical protein ACHAWO_009745 [Cyclotella atomus]|jgi:hypothetical protein|uniref:Uncharacterized protein n=1 Tax=Cyclotella atomus TaxID=382360 RepID=A0ABD3PUL5_9STRA
MLSFEKTASVVLATAQYVAAGQTLQLSPHDIHRNLLRQMGGLNGLFNTYGSSHTRNAQEVDCPETPYLWKIIENDSGKHVGFGLGTMHVPSDLILSDGSYSSIFSAIADSCDVYGEINLRDPAIIEELGQCIIPLVENAATVIDIQDQDIKSAYEAKLLEIATSVAPDESLVDGIYQALLLLPIFLVQQYVLYSNTPEYEQYLLLELAGTPASALDDDVLSIGRVPGGLEEVSTQCAILEQLYVTQDNLDNQALLAGLNATLSSQISAYKCGSIETMESAFDVESELGNNTEFEMQLLGNRNEQMASAIADILNSSNNKAFFAVGFLHWLHGDKSLNNLLNDYGYSLELVPNYGPDDAEDISNEQCGVTFNRTSGVFELDEAESQGTFSTTVPNANTTITEGTDVSGDSEEDSENVLNSADGTNDEDNSSNMFKMTFTSILCIIGLWCFTY